MILGMSLFVVNWGAHIVFGSANTCTAHNSEDDFIVGEWDSVKEEGWVYL